MTWTTVWYVLPLSSRWMMWNLFLALIPLGLSLWLFRRPGPRSLGWWLGMAAFVAFLPNAPYVLTDLIHLTEEIHENNSLLFNTLVLLPKYALFVFIGFEAYVLSLMNLGHYLKQQGLASAVLQVELVLHGLCAIGVYLGRFERFNSWDLMTRPHHVFHSLAENLLDPRPLFFMVLGLVTIAGLYWVMKQISLALLLQHQYAETLRQQSLPANGRE
jgi:uncharacterized membrane protein